MSHVLSGVGAYIQGRRETDVTWQEGRWFAVALRIYSVVMPSPALCNCCLVCLLPCDVHAGKSLCPVAVPLTLHHVVLKFRTCCLQETRAQGNKNACRSAYAARGKGGSRAAREARAQSAAQVRLHTCFSIAVEQGWCDHSWLKEALSDIAQGLHDAF